MDYNGKCKLINDKLIKCRERFEDDLKHCQNFYFALRQCKDNISSLNINNLINKNQNNI